MKRNILTPILLFAMIFLIGCTKEETPHPKTVILDEKIALLYEGVPDYEYGTITTINNGQIVCFESAEQYLRTIDKLSRQCETWAHIFFTEYQECSETNLDSIITSLGYREDLPLLIFEENNGIEHSLRSYCDYNECNWLESDDNTLPPMDTVIISPIEQTLFSKYYEICINDTIYQIKNNGNWLIIPISEISSISDARNATTEQQIQHYMLQHPTVKYENNPNGCYYQSFFQKGIQHHSEVGDRFFRWSYKFNNCPFLHRCKTVVSMSNYKYVNGAKKRDYAICSLSHNTTTYSYFFEQDSCCLGIGPLPNTQTPMKFHHRSMINFSSQYASVENGSSVTIGPFTYNYHDYIETKQVDPSQSFIRCRHQGWTYAYNVETGNLQNN